MSFSKKKTSSELSSKQPLTISWERKKLPTRSTDKINTPCPLDRNGLIIIYQAKVFPLSAKPAQQGQVSQFSLPVHFSDYGRLWETQTHHPALLLSPGCPPPSQSSASAPGVLLQPLFWFKKYLSWEMCSPHTAMFSPLIRKAQRLALVCCSLRWDFKTCHTFPRSHSRSPPSALQTDPQGRLKSKSISWPMTFHPWQLCGCSGAHSAQRMSRAQLGQRVEQIRFAWALLRLVCRKDIIS